MLTPKKTFLNPRSKSKKQNDELKKDLLMLAKTLESSKVSGKDLSGLLIELGHRLQKPEENSQ